MHVHQNVLMHVQVNVLHALIHADSNVVHAQVNAHQIVVIYAIHHVLKNVLIHAIITVYNHVHKTVVGVQIYATHV